MADLVRIPLTIQKKQKLDAIKTQIIHRVKLIDKFSNPIGLDIIHFVSLLAKNLLTADLDVVLSEFVIQIFQLLYPSLSQADLQQIEANIEYLESLGLIKRVPILIRALNWAYQIASNLLAQKKPNW